jgi:predicted ABC-type ATPase
VSEARNTEGSPERSLSLEELARTQHAQTLTDPDQLAADIWESDEELEAFLQDLRAARNAHSA